MGNQEDCLPHVQTARVIARKDASTPESHASVNAHLPYTHIFMMYENNISKASSKK
jgi:hypothetical protein